MFENIAKPPNYGSMGETTPLDIIRAGGDATGPASSVLPSSTQAKFGEKTLKNATPVSSGQSNMPSSLSSSSGNSNLFLFTRAGLGQASKK